MIKGSFFLLIGPLYPEPERVMIEFDAQNFKLLFAWMPSVFPVNGNGNVR